MRQLFLQMVAAECSAVLLETKEFSQNFLFNCSLVHILYSGILIVSNQCVQAPQAFNLPVTCSKAAATRAIFCSGW